MVPASEDIQGQEDCRTKDLAGWQCHIHPPHMIDDIECDVRYNVKSRACFLRCHGPGDGTNGAVDGGEKVIVVRE